MLRLVLYILLFNKMKTFNKLGVGEEIIGAMWASSPTLERWNGEGVAPLLI